MLVKAEIIGLVVEEAIRREVDRGGTLGVEVGIGVGSRMGVGSRWGLVWTLDSVLGGL